MEEAQYLVVLGCVLMIDVCDLGMYSTMLRNDDFSFRLYTFWYGFMFKTCWRYLSVNAHNTIPKLEQWKLQIEAAISLRHPRDPRGEAEAMGALVA